MLVLAAQQQLLLVADATQAVVEHLDGLLDRVERLRAYTSDEQRRMYWHWETLPQRRQAG